MSFYNAAGVKLKKEVHAVLPTNEITTTDYLGGFQYENSILQFFPHAEGYVKNTLNKIGSHFAPSSTVEGIKKGAIS